MKLILAVVLIAMATGCANPIKNRIDRMAISDTPDAKRAYLIINANVVPSDQRQPTWINIWRGLIGEHLSTSKVIFELRPTKFLVKHIDFQESPKSSSGTINVRLEYGRRTPVIKLEAGIIYYYGRLEIEISKRKTLLRTVPDPALYRRACEQAPELFGQFEVVVIGPLAKEEVVFPPCDELLRDSGADSAQIRD